MKIGIVRKLDLSNLSDQCKEPFSFSLGNWTLCYCVIPEKGCEAWY